MSLLSHLRGRCAVQALEDWIVVPLEQTRCEVSKISYDSILAICSRAMSFAVDAVGFSASFI